MRERAGAVARLVEEKTGRKTKVDTTVKNNVTRTGIMIETDQEGIYATVYMDDFNDQQEEEAAEKIKEIIERTKHPDIDVKTITRREYVISNIITYPIKREGNEELLENYPHVDFQDLAFVFRVMVQEREGSYLLKTEMAENYGLSASEIFDIAKENVLKKQNIKIVPVGNVMASILGIDEEDEEDVPRTECGMAVMTNQENMYGASAFLRKDLLKKYSERIGKDLYILPSSVHELLIVPKTIATADILREMVREVNENTVSDEDILSYNVYEYNRNSDEIAVAP